MSVVARRTRRRMSAPVYQSTSFEPDYTRREMRNLNARVQVHIPDRAACQADGFCGSGARHLYASCLDSNRLLRQPIGRSDSRVRERWISWRGLDKRAALGVLIAALVILLLILGGGWRAKMAAAASVEEARDSVRSAQAEIKVLTEKRAAAERSCNVSYEAARQGMVSGVNVPSITLTLAPAGRSYREAMNAQAQPAQENTAGTEPATLAMLAQ